MFDRNRAGVQTCAWQQANEWVRNKTGEPINILFAICGRAVANSYINKSIIPLLCAKEVLRRVGVFKAAHLRQPDASRMDEQDHRELSVIMERMGPPF